MPSFIASISEPESVPRISSYISQHKTSLDDRTGSSVHMAEISIVRQKKTQECLMLVCAHRCEAGVEAEEPVLLDEPEDQSDRAHGRDLVRLLLCDLARGEPRRQRLPRSLGFARGVWTAKGQRVTISAAVIRGGSAAVWSQLHLCRQQQADRRSSHHVELFARARV